jgi:multisubunit Na+/H+ antiporter MnhB subunit
MSAGALDLLLFGALIAVGVRLLTAADARVAAILFIVFGLLLTLSWVRLAAPDVALAEAAIGAGVTGALLLHATARIDTPQALFGSAGRTRLLAAAGMLVCLGGAGFLAAVVLNLPAPGAGAAATAALQNVGDTGVSHPVTAVLLAYRAYDTLIEIAVLLTAAIVATGLPSADDEPATPGVGVGVDPVLAQALVVTLPLALVVAVFLLWAGARTTGGAFQAGSVLAGALLLARFSGARLDPSGPGPLPRLLQVVGVLVFIAAGAAGIGATGTALAWPSATAGAWILAIETALMISIGAALVAFFPGGGPRR